MLVFFNYSFQVFNLFSWYAGENGINTVPYRIDHTHSKMESQLQFFGHQALS